MDVHHEDSDPRAALRESIIHAIRPWQASENIVDPPPFPPEVLAVMALALHDKPLRIQHIWSWTQQTFAHFRHLPPALYTGVWGERGLRGVLCDYDVPVRYKRVDDGKWFGEGEAWEIGADEAALFLRGKGVLQGDARDVREEASFHFLALPPEIKNRIYAMVFAFPPSGVQIDRHDTDSQPGVCYTATRDFHEPFDFKPWVECSDDFIGDELSEDHWNHSSPTQLLNAGRLSDRLALLATNRQIRDEALYIFASINSFHFTTAAHMLKVLQRMSLAQRHQIHHLTLVHRPGPSETTAIKKVFGLLAAMPRLENLHLYIDKALWEERYFFWRDRPLVKIMGFDEAPALPNNIKLEVVMPDFAEGIEEAIRAESVLPPAEAKTAEELWEENKFTPAGVLFSFINIGIGVAGLPLSLAAGLWRKFRTR